MTESAKVIIRGVHAAAFAAEADATATMFIASRRAMLPGLLEPHTEAETRTWIRDSVFARHSVRPAGLRDEV